MDVLGKRNNISINLKVYVEMYLFDNKEYLNVLGIGYIMISKISIIFFLEFLV